MAIIEKIGKKRKLIGEGNVRADMAKRRVVDSIKDFKRQRKDAELVNTWLRGDQYNSEVTAESGRLIGRPWMPNRADGAATEREYEDVAERSPSPFGRLVVASLAQTVYFESARIAGRSEDAPKLQSVRALERNAWGRQQQSVTRATIAHGLSFVAVRIGTDPMTGASYPHVRPFSSSQMTAYFDDPYSEWPAYAIEYVMRETVDDEQYDIYDYWDEEGIERVKVKAVAGEGEVDPKDAEYQGNVTTWDLPVTPIVPFLSEVDIEGHAVGEIMPIIPLLRRLDQDTFDRLVVQRFGAWLIRYIAGLEVPGSEAEKRRKEIELTIRDLVVLESENAKMGSVPGTSTDGYIAATDHDLRILAAVTQTPPHHLLGLSSNLQAEALAAAEAGLQRKSTDFRMTNESSYEQLLRLIAYVGGFEDEVRAEFQVRWRDTESRSLTQAAQALGTLATQLGVPVDMLWSQIPGWSDDDVDRARQLVENGDAQRFIEKALALNAQRLQQEATQQAQEQESTGGSDNAE